MTKPKIAVIAVHGVADQQPGDSARQIADLLEEFKPPALYAPFTETRIRIPLEPVAVREGDDHERMSILAASVNERSAYVRRHLASKTPPPPDEWSRPSHQFMRNQLRCYQPRDPRTFDTVRLESVRNGACHVHVYEAYWADLSRLQKALFTFFAELYQLILHLPSIGRTAVDHAAVVNAEDRRWRWLSGIQGLSVRTLTLGVVVLNLALLTLVPLVLAVRVDESVLKAVGISVAGLAGVVAGALALRTRIVGRLVWVVAPALTGGSAALIALYLTQRWGVLFFAAFVTWCIAAGALVPVLSAFSERRPGALGAGILALLGTGTCLLILLIRDDSVIEALLKAFQIGNLALRVAWIAHGFAMISTVLYGFYCALRTKPAWRKQALRTAWTAQFSILFPTALFANLTLTVWSAILLGLSKLYVGGSTVVYPLLPIPFNDRGGFADSLSVTDFASKMLENASSAFVLINSVFAAISVFALWSILPSVLVEASPPQRQDEKSTRMVALGQWLSRGLTCLPWVLAIVLPGTWIFVAIKFLNAFLTSPSHGWRFSVSAVTTAGAVLIAMIGARFWLPGAEGALDVVMDVDSYLREHPVEQNPRARIAERHASLLRYVVKQRYDAIVIIAHSQGSVITADLLRFLRVENDPLFKELDGKMTLFTMGCPLGQLYGKAFPALYEWMESDPTTPDPGGLGLVRWINAYRTGDYVGRWLWRKGDDPNLYRRREKDPQNIGEPTASINGHREELCIGEGAHTHYWDITAKDIGRRLDAIVRDLC